MTETETKRNHECSYNKYYNMPSREELHRCYGGYLSESDFTTANVLTNIVDKFGLLNTAAVKFKLSCKQC